MNKHKVASIVNYTIETKIPSEVRQWLTDECEVVVNDLSDWTLSPSKYNEKDMDTLGAFGFENGKPTIGINHKMLKPAKEAMRVTLHEIAHAWLWKMGLPNGERQANKLAREWDATSL